ncbi:MAG: hypothetical protein F2677_05825 [Actinobacteria bacterium]|uniref:Unannotated protein n=1 Tax=freshwater metagenome TaxID=449393 RepID=A0A6J6QQT9_9ZZZZ|nr:hypothetical protein [Actinomycetota bacterium]MSZ69379.1 hypothetical protein [Actinomycetota bacterium]
MKKRNLLTISMVSAALIMGSTSSASADVSPSPSPSTPAIVIAPPTSAATGTLAQRQAAYRAALIKYQADLVKYQAAMVIFKASAQVNQDKRKVINATFNAALKKAKADFALVLATPNVTVDQKTAATTARNAATAAATAVRKAALDLIVQATPPIKPMKPLRPTRGENEKEGKEGKEKSEKSESKEKKKS